MGMSPVNINSNLNKVIRNIATNFYLKKCDMYPNSRDN